MVMDLPECPVCLEAFDGESRIPRVLACGHSTCQICLLHLPKPPLFPCTIRCPACTQLVTYPQSPSSLPKNIDLLRFSSSFPRSSNPKPEPEPKPKPKPRPDFDFLPNLWSHEFYHKWKQWIVPQDSELIKSNQIVSLFKIASFTDNNDNDNNDDDDDDDDEFKYSYVAKVMMILFKMRDECLVELDLILTLASKEYRICSAYGLWYNNKDDYLYLVCERKHTSLLNLTVKDDDYDDISSVGMIGMELYETFSRLHDVGLVSGCTSFSCFVIDGFGHMLIDLNQVLIDGERVQKIIKDSIRSEMDSNDVDLESHVYPSPEVLVELIRKEAVDFDFDMSKCTVGFSSDVWSLACVLLSFLLGMSFVDETRGFLSSYILKLVHGNTCECEELYATWLDNVSGFLDGKLGLEYTLMKELLQKCLCFDPKDRPLVNDVWKFMRGLIIKPKLDVISSSEQKATNESTSRCLVLADLIGSSNKTVKNDETGAMNDSRDDNVVVESDVIEGVRKSSLSCIEMKGHLDCISGLAIGGGFLFSSSFDKTVNVWSLQGSNRVHTFKGHEHKVMAVVYVDSEPPLCISADNGGDIFIWAVNLPFDEKPVKRLNEEKDWRYSGVHSLAVSSTSGYLYTGSGDKSIKAWSLNDYSLSYTMNGHKSVVSTLAVCNEVLYSGSWDGTVRLWCLSDHSPLAVLGEERPVASVLSVATHTHTLVAAYENGSIKVWNKDVFLNSISPHSSSIFSICMEGPWLFSGGWNKTIVVQKLSGNDESGVEEVTEIGSIQGDSVVTALSYWEGRLFVGHADRTIKVYSFGG
ncbi:uncharacterized protein [Rutidosis leptorrhynchoides]|uniref:uncharacterized protein n=1 Tax=Rutidosis leptorrhynchoides TaxID=125765 RepID=UPI003A99FB6F